MDVIETERLHLERLDEAHRAPFGRMCSDPRVMRFIGDGALWSPERFNETFDRKLHHWEEHGFGWRAASTRKDGQWVGVFALQPIGGGTLGDLDGIDPDAIEIGWWVEPELWGRGYATEAALALRDEAFGRIGLEGLLARLLPENRASAAVAEKIGLRFERIVQSSGTRIDVAIYFLDRPA
jgi:RimJ/RimL family protein N-acetyltransferase